MTRQLTQFEATPAGLSLANAILLYRSEGNGRQGMAFASIHAVEEVGGKPSIAAGSPLSRAHLRQWTEALGRNAPPEILPGNVLVSHPDVLAWWVPEQVRTAYFALSLGKSSGRDSLKVLKERTSMKVPYPAHLFVATRKTLGVYALPANERPDADTRALFSPILNVFINGHLCWGNIPKPKALSVASIAEYESAVFDSWSTHPNTGQERTVTGKGGLVKLWDDLAARGAKRFPVKRMKPFATQRAPAVPVTVGKLIAGVAGA